MGDIILTIRAYTNEYQLIHVEALDNQKLLAIGAIIDTIHTDENSCTFRIKKITATINGSPTKISKLDVASDSELKKINAIRELDQRSLVDNAYIIQTEHDLQFDIYGQSFENTELTVNKNDVIDIHFEDSILNHKNKSFKLERQNVDIGSRMCEFKVVW